METRCLGQQQWTEAAYAFAETTKIDPGYVDGHVNQAIAEYSRWIESRKESPVSTQSLLAAGRHFTVRGQAQQFVAH